MANSWLGTTVMVFRDIWRPYVMENGNHINSNSVKRHPIPDPWDKRQPDRKSDSDIIPEYSRKWAVIISGPSGGDGEIDGDR